MKTRANSCTGMKDPDKMTKGELRVYAKGLIAMIHSLQETVRKLTEVKANAETTELP